MTAATRETAAQSIWEQITNRYNAAQASQASSFTETDTELYEDTSTGLSPSTLPPLSYIVKVARRLREKPKNASNKPAATREEKMKNNPFLPPDPELYVMQLTPTHSLVLNKFNITPHHVIVITDAFEEQEVPLSVADFEATWMVVRGMQGEREGVEGVEGVERDAGGDLDARWTNRARSDRGSKAGIRTWMIRPRCRFPIGCVEEGRWGRTRRAIRRARDVQTGRRRRTRGGRESSAMRDDVRGD